MAMHIQACRVIIHAAPHSLVAQLLSLSLCTPVVKEGTAGRAHVRRKAAPILRCVRRWCAPSSRWARRPSAAARRGRQRRGRSTGAPRGPRCACWRLSGSGRERAWGRRQHGRSARSQRQVRRASERASGGVRPRRRAARARAPAPPARLPCEACGARSPARASVPGATQHSTAQRSPASPSPALTSAAAGVGLRLRPAARQATRWCVARTASAAPRPPRRALCTARAKSSRRQARTPSSSASMSRGAAAACPEDASRWERYARNATRRSAAARAARARAAREG